MKVDQLIDAKGRLFSRLNVIDLGVVTVIVVMGYGLFLATRIMSGELRRWPPATAATVAPVVVHATVLLRELDHERVEQIRVGDREQDETNREVARILQLGAPQPDFVDVVFGNISVEADRLPLFRLPVVMLLIGEARGGTFFFQGRLIGPGSAIMFHTPRYRVTGTIIKAFPISGNALKAG